MKKIRKPMSKEIKDKISKSMTGHTVSEESKAKMRKSKLGKKRKPHSQETIEKIKQSNKNTFASKPKRIWTELDKAIHSERMKVAWEMRNDLTKSVKRI